MEAQPVRAVIGGTALPLRGDDIDTDRIIPARYLKCVTFEELGQYAFYDERFDPEGREKPHPFNDKRFQDAEILVVNGNFGCGSSREHAPQSLMRMGIRAIVGESFAEIFAGNCTALGIPAVSVSHENAEKLMELVEIEPDTIVTVDLKARMVSGGDVSAPLDMPESYRRSLVEGTWDTTTALLANVERIRTVTERLPYMTGSYG